MSDTQYDHYGYLISIADRLRPLQPGGAAAHPVQAGGLKDIISIMSGTLLSHDLPLIVADYNEGATFIDNGSDNLICLVTYTVYIFYPADPADIRTIARAKKESKALANQIVARLKRDHGLQQFGLDHLVLDSIEIQHVGLTGDRLYGVALRYDIIQPSPARFNPALWKD